MALLSIAISTTMSYCPNHTHSVWEVILNLQGEGKMIAGDKEYLYKPGTIICLPPGMPHNKLCEGQFRDLYILVSPFNLLSEHEKNSVLVFQDDEEKSVETLLNLANRVYHKKEKNYRETVDSLYASVENILLGWTQNGTENTEIEKLKNILINEFTDPELSIDSLLSETAYCKDHFRRLFKKITGLTPVTYLTQLRLNYAKTLLSRKSELNYSITDICVMSGFYDLSYFSRIFKKYTGKSPQEYMRSKSKTATS